MPAASGVLDPIACALPSGQKSSVCTVENATPSGSVRIGPSLFGAEKNSGSASGNG